MFCKIVQSSLFWTFIEQQNIKQGSNIFLLNLSFIISMVTYKYISFLMFKTSYSFIKFNTYHMHFCN